MAGLNERPLPIVFRISRPRSTRTTTVYAEVCLKGLSPLKVGEARHRDCKVVRRRGKIFVICKSNPRFKARQR